MPTFKWGKKYYVKASCCGSVFELSEEKGKAIADQIGRNYAVRVATSDALVQISSLRSGVLRMSARELWQEVETTRQEMRKRYENEKIRR